MDYPTKNRINGIKKAESGYLDIVANCKHMDQDSRNHTAIQRKDLDESSLLAKKTGYTFGKFQY
jgi:hypothetical protein